MNKFTKAAVVCAAVAMTCTVAKAQDFILGFTAPGDSDYTVDIGPVLGTSGIEANNTQIYHYGSAISISTLNATISSGASAGVGAGYAQSQPGDWVVASVARLGNNAQGSQGTENAPAQPTYNSTSSGANSIYGAGLGVTPNVVNGVVQQNTFTWQAGGNAGTFSSYLNLNPSVALNGGTVALDLFEAVRQAPIGSGRNQTFPTSPWTYVGQLDINVSGTTATADFVPEGFSSLSAVPEPASYGLLAGAGLLALSVRRQFHR